MGIDDPKSDRMFSLLAVVHATDAADPVRQYVTSTWILPLLAMAPFALGTYFFERRLPPTKLLVFFAQIAATLPLALVGFWYVCVPREERQNRIQQLRQAMFAHR